MNEYIEQLIQENGERWGAQPNRDKTPVTVSLNLNLTGGPVFDLTLPPNESHPHWRVTERGMTVAEADELVARYAERKVERIGSLIPLDGGKYFRVRAHVRNGRESGWSNSVEYVEVTIVRAWPFGAAEPNLLAVARGNEGNLHDPIRVVMGG